MMEWLSPPPSLSTRFVCRGTVDYGMHRPMIILSSVFAGSNFGLDPCASQDEENKVRKQCFLRHPPNNAVRTAFLLSRASTRLISSYLSLSLSHGSNSPWFLGEGVALTAELGLAQLPANLESALSDDGVFALTTHAIRVFSTCMHTQARRRHVLSIGYRMQGRLYCST